MTKIKPVCLVVGDDDIMLAQLSSLLETKVELFMAPYQDACEIILSSHISIVLVLWSSEADYFAHEIQDVATSAKILVERPRASFAERPPKNGFAGEFDRDSCADLVRQILTLTEEDQTALAKTTLSNAVSISNKINLEGFIDRLPQVQATIENRQSLSLYLLDSMMSATRALRGALFTLSGEDFVLSVERNSNLCDRSIARKTTLIASMENHLAGHHVDDIKAPKVIRRFLLQTNCQVMLPVFGASELIAFFVLAPSADFDESSLAIQSILFYTAESLQLCHRISGQKEEQLYLEAALKQGGHLSLVIDQLGVVKFYRDELQVLETRGPLLGKSYTKLLNGHLKSKITSGLSKTFSDSTVCLCREYYHVTTVPLPLGETLFSLKKVEKGPSNKLRIPWRSWIATLQSLPEWKELSNNKKLTFDNINQSHLQLSQLHEKLKKNEGLVEGDDIKISRVEAEVIMLYSVCINSMESTRIKWIGKQKDNVRMVCIDIESSPCDLTPLLCRWKEVASLAAEGIGIEIQYQDAYYGGRWTFNLPGMLLDTKFHNPLALQIQGEKLIKEICENKCNALPIENQNLRISEDALGTAHPAARLG